MMPTLHVEQEKQRIVPTHRWLVVVLSVAVQLGVLSVLFFSTKQSSVPDMTLATVVGRPDVCRVVTVEPFTDAAAHNVQPGMLVKVVDTSSTITHCELLTQQTQFQIVGQNTRFHVFAAQGSFDKTDMFLATLLALIFTVTGATIFLWASDRQLAWVSYGLFYICSLMFCLLNARFFNALFTNIALMLLMMITRGLSTTFACLFPRPQPKPSLRFLPYLPILMGIVISLVGIPLAVLVSPARVGVLFSVFAYNVVCIFVVVWILIRGFKHLSGGERQLVRMVVISVIFLLLPLVFAIDVIRTGMFFEASLVRLLPIPLVVLPIVSEYVMLRQQLVGTTSLLSRRAVRVLLWLLLASLFLFPDLLLFRLSSLFQQDKSDYFYALLLGLNLFLFPILWKKVRNIGDQVFYRDFYQYNRSLRELSAALTQMHGLEQISSYVLPTLATLLNATDVALLIRVQPQSDIIHTGVDKEGIVLPWHMYHHVTAQSHLMRERLASVANLALTHMTQVTHEPLLLDGVLLLALYDGTYLNGFLCLGPKVNLEPYSRQDASFLATLASQLSVLVVNNRYLERAQSDAEKLAALNHRVVLAQEEERRHLALELHDEVLQEAMLLVRQLSDAGTMSDVAETMPLARSIVSSLRHTCLELRPPLLDELGLGDALDWLACQTMQHSGGSLHIDVLREGEYQQRPPFEVELAFYRVCQEALTNVLKHASASKVIVRLRYARNGDVRLVMRDDGRGFKKGTLLIESLGLIGMHERMAAIGGRLQIRTSPGQGVTIRATFAPSPFNLLSFMTEIERKQGILNEQQTYFLAQKRITV